MQTPDQVTDALVRLASEQGGIRALILTSSRANPGQADLQSDYDVILAVTDAASFGGRNGWEIDRDGLTKGLTLRRSPPASADG